MASRNWDPNKIYNISETEQKAVEERRQMRTKIKAEWQQKVTNPYRGYGGSIFDPNIQRFYTMKATGMENFKATSKTAFGGLLIAGFTVAIAYHGYRSDTKKEELYRTGQIAYKDRAFKTIQ